MFDYVAGTGSDALDLATVADELDDAVDAVPGGPYNATHTATSVTVVRADGAPFTADFLLIASGTATEAARNSIRLDLAGTPHLDERWIVTVGGITRFVDVNAADLADADAARRRGEAARRAGRWHRELTPPARTARRSPSPRCKTA